MMGKLIPFGAPRPERKPLPEDHPAWIDQDQPWTEADAERESLDNSEPGEEAEVVNLRDIPAAWLPFIRLHRKRKPEAEWGAE